MDTKGRRMRQLLGWVKNRISCSINGHKLIPKRIYYPPAKTMVSGYECKRCHKTQVMLRRWQTVERGNDHRQDEAIEAFEEINDE